MIIHCSGFSNGAVKALQRVCEGTPREIFLNIFKIMINDEYSFKKSFKK